MDLNNNQAGRDIITRSPDISENDLIDEILDDINNGSDVEYFSDWESGEDASDLTTGSDNNKIGLGGFEAL